MYGAAEAGVEVEVKIPNPKIQNPKKIPNDEIPKSQRARLRLVTRAGSPCHSNRRDCVASHGLAARATGQTHGLEARATGEASPRPAVENRRSA